ncbi:glycosyl hydrolase family 18 protein [Bacillus sp. BP-3]|uniref:glycosyl hydrolase family 18 protein n=1 Tax=Bacillus sp. BP-3 TaxID=3022773 RepID=UPI00232AB177|nr:LysM peptidoglycan-binding domain-containing protein [Bacillus sp. BP-3]MDC2867670.1 glycosyl hydrolase family 18 protein [Bacillus sp. BP-3]
MLQIITVQSGDNVYKLAKQYGTTAEIIVKDNGLNPGETLVVGQALIVNTHGNTYYVQPGDSLYKISLTYNVPLASLAKVNHLSLKSPLQVGQQLYVPKGTKKIIESIAYLQPSTIPIKESLIASTKAINSYLTYLAYFSFEAKRDGTLKEPTQTSEIVSIAKQGQTIPMLVITNLENGSFSSELASIILRNETIQNTFITNILQTAQKYGMRDVHFDFENFAPADREAYNQFLRKVKTRLPKGYTLSTTVVPKTSSTQKGPAAAHDYKAQGEIVDFVVIMTYDWGWQGGPPLAVSPIGPVKQVLQYAKSQMPPRKIMMGQNLYGFDWIVPFKPGNPPAKAVSSIAAVALARKHNVPIQYDFTSQAPHFNYYDANGVKHEVWFEDARSVQSKFNLIKELGIRGISYWKIGLPFPQNWRLLSENFSITKKG